MDKPIVIDKEQAITFMEENLRRIKACSDSDKFLVLSYDLVNNKSLGKIKLDDKGGRKLINESRTFILYDEREELSTSILSIYSERQRDIYNILPIGKKHDMILIPQLE